MNVFTPDVMIFTKIVISFIDHHSYLKHVSVKRLSLNNFRKLTICNSRFHNHGVKTVRIMNYVHRLRPLLPLFTEFITNRTYFLRKLLMEQGHLLLSKTNFNQENFNGSELCRFSSPVFEFQSKRSSLCFYVYWVTTVDQLTL